MSHRLQVLIPEELEARLQKAAQRTRMSKGEWVRRAIEDTLERSGEVKPSCDALSQLASLGAPTGDIKRMLAEIEAGRS
ncbi:MAG: CopG family transcriptional regulator [Acidobacteria bacterium]|nr:CopG family transcriptional regulator [Acidobacteriota bacterium]